MNILLNLFNLALFGCQATFVASIQLENGNDERTLQLGNPCGAFDWCPDGFSCTNGICYHLPRQEGEPCGNLAYCDSNLDCENEVCVDRFDTGDCAQDNGSGSAPTPGRIKVMSYNLFLINCVVTVPHYGDLVPCQNDPEKAKRSDEIAKWVKKRKDDVIMFQEIFDDHDKIKNAMIEAAYCHYVTTRKGNKGSGLAIYSKYPIEEHDFKEWPLTLNPESFADKGVLYVKIKRGEEYIHFFNMHTMSDSLCAGCGQSARHDQFQIVRNFINEKVISNNELILLGGDLNEDKYSFGGEYYEEMLQVLNASAFTIGANGNLYTYDTEKNALTGSKYDEDHEGYTQLLDYVLYDNRGVQPNSESSCLIRIPRGTKVTDTNDPTRMLSDHFPVVCNITYPIQPGQPPSSPMFVAEIVVLSGSVCDADNWPSGDSDPYISVKLSRNGFEHICGTTTRLSNTNNPEWNERISCNNFHFKATDFTEIVFSAYDHDTGFNGQDDFIGSGTVSIDTDLREKSGVLILKNGSCNKDGTLEYIITVEEIS